MLPFFQLPLLILVASQAAAHQDRWPLSDMIILTFVTITIIKWNSQWQRKDPCREKALSVNLVVPFILRYLLASTSNLNVGRKCTAFPAMCPIIISLILKILYINFEDDKQRYGYPRSLLKCRTLFPGCKGVRIGVDDDVERNIIRACCRS